MREKCEGVRMRRLKKGWKGKGKDERREEHETSKGKRGLYLARLLLGDLHMTWIWE